MTLVSRLKLNYLCIFQLAFSFLELVHSLNADKMQNDTTTNAHIPLGINIKLYSIFLQMNIVNQINILLIENM